MSDAASAMIKMQDGKTYSVKGVLARDATTDFAILKVETSGLPVLPLGNSDHVRQGDKILTLGSPQGLEGTASEGIVSAVRLVGKARHLQITAPISKGNSGGPVLNLRGEVVGIAVFYLKDSQSLNFAVAINEIRPDLSSSAILSPLPAYVSPNPTAAIAGKMRNTAAEKLFELGSTAHAAERYQEAAAYFDGAAAKRPTWALAWCKAALAHLCAGDGKGCEFRLAKALRVNPRYGYAYLVLGRSRRSMFGKDENAVAPFAQAVRFSTRPADKAEALTDLSEIDVRNGRLSRALREIISANEAEPQSVRSFGAGIICVKLGRAAQAETFLAKGRKAVQDSAEGWRRLGDSWQYNESAELLFGEERFSKAIDAYTRSVALSTAAQSEYTARVYCSLAAVQAHMRLWNAEISSYRSAEAINPMSLTIDYRLSLGAAYLKVDDLNSAERQCDLMKSSNLSMIDSIGLEDLRSKIEGYKVAHGLIGVFLDMGVCIQLDKRQAADAATFTVAFDGILTNDAPRVQVNHLSESVFISFDILNYSNGPHTIEVRCLNKNGHAFAHAVLIPTIDNSGSNAATKVGYIVSMDAEPVND
jgi:tetratricopeptide (TPR) repeat protein